MEDDFYEKKKRLATENVSNIREYETINPSKKMKINYQTNLEGLNQDEDVEKDSKVIEIKGIGNGHLEDHISEPKINNTHLVSVNEGRQFTCDMCDKQYTETSSLKRHKESIHDGVRYPCDQCDSKPFKDESGLRKHKESVHEGKRYPCDQCDSEPFPMASGLWQHKASVHEGRTYPCDQCDIVPFSYSKALKQHKESVHEGIKYNCDQCDSESFPLKSGLWYHKASVHEGNYRKYTHLVSPNETRQFTCDICGKQYADTSNVKRHKASVHNGVRYPCDHCDSKPFTDKSGLRYHQESVHEGIRYFCNQCDYKATQTGNLKTHIKKYHS